MSNHPYSLRGMHYEMHEHMHLQEGGAVTYGDGVFVFLIGRDNVAAPVLATLNAL